MCEYIFPFGLSICIYTILFYMYGYLNIISLYSGPFIIA